MKDHIIPLDIETEIEKQCQINMNLVFLIPKTQNVFTTGLLYFYVMSETTGKRRGKKTCNGS